MKPSEEQWNLWIDGELSPEEVEALKSASAAEGVSLDEDQAFFGQLSEDLQATFPAERTPPFADFFNSHLQKQMRDLDEAEAAEPARASWLPKWLHLSWAAPLAAAALVVFTLTQIGIIGEKTHRGSQIVSAYTPDESIFAVTSFDAEANAMVIRLEGMERLPAEFDLILADADNDRHEGPFVVDADLDINLEEEFVGPQIEFVMHRPAY